jgi:RHS repeat-associated protein
VLFTYDAEGRRHSKTAKLYRDGALKDTTTTTWIWDGWHPVIERVIDAKLDKPIVERKLVWGPDLSGQPGGAGGAGGLLLIRETNHTFDGRPPVITDLLPLYDGSGNIVGLANPQGDLLAEYWYGPFGELLEATGSHAATNPWRWASKSFDPETGLVYFGLRYYDPATGQWLSREPLGEGESLNLYAYCHNDPINRVDVLGASEYFMIEGGWVRAWFEGVCREKGTEYQDYKNGIAMLEANGMGDSVVRVGVFDIAASGGVNAKDRFVQHAQNAGYQASLAQQADLRAGATGYAAFKTGLAQFVGGVSGSYVFAQGYHGQAVVYSDDASAFSAELSGDESQQMLLGGGVQMFGTAAPVVYVVRVGTPYVQGFRAGATIQQTRLSMPLARELDKAPLGGITLWSFSRVSPIVSCAEPASPSFGFVPIRGSWSESRWSFAPRTTTSTALVPYYPPNNGFAGATTREFLMPGQTIDRFGGSGASRFFSPTGTSEPARALPPGTAGQPLRTFEVVKPFEVDAGTAAPWFGQPGGGSQFRTPVSLETLLKRGILREQ